MLIEERAEIQYLKEAIKKVRIENIFLRGCLEKETCKKLLDLKKKINILEKRCLNLRMKVKENNTPIY